MTIADQEPKRLRVIFFTPTNKKTGAGVENVFAEFALNKPEWADVKIIQGTYMPGARLDDDVMKGSWRTQKSKR